MAVFFDYFARPATLVFGKSKRFKTSIGFVFTLIFFAAVSLAFFYSFIRMLQRKSPTSNQVDLFVYEPPLMNVQDQLFAFAITFRDQKLGSLVADYHFKIKAYNEEWVYFVNENTGQKDMNLKSTPMNIRKCQLSDYENHLDSLARGQDLIDISMLFCIPRDQDKELFNIKGRIGSVGYQYIRVEFEPCDEVGCAPEAMMKAVLATANIIFAYEDSYIDINDYDNPLKPAQGGVYDHMNYDYWREKFIELVPIEVRTDFAFIGKNERVHRGFTYQISGTMFDLPVIKSRYTFFIRLSNQKKIITREYAKFQDVLAETTDVACSHCHFDSTLFKN